jgi:ADP-ribose pyrophosphatase
MKNGKVKKLSVLAQSKYLSLYDAEYINKNGDERHWMIASRKDQRTLEGLYFKGTEEKIDATIIAAIHKESKKLVLIKQFRIPINDYVYELPAGLVDPDEDMEATVSRELREETGLKLLKINHEKTKEGVYVSTGMTDESVAMVYCSCEGEVNNAYLEADEDIEVFLVSKEEAKDILSSNAKIDIKAFMMLQIFAELGEKAF